MNSVDPHRCPLCKADNACAVAHGRGACWCFSREIARSTLEQIPPDVYGHACLCQTCAYGDTALPPAFQRMNEILRRRRG